MHRAHSTQKLQNYFDSEDTRMREQSYSLGAQLLNAVAQPLDELTLQLERERRAAAPLTAPLHLDNGGCWWVVRPPAGWIAPAADVPLALKGIDAEGEHTLLAYDSLLPVPQAIGRDPDREPVAFTEPLLAEVAGTAPVLVLPGSELPVPTRLVFWLDCPMPVDPLVDIAIEGGAFPSPAWSWERNPAREDLVISHKACSLSRTVWQSITRLTVRRLPACARLRVYRLPVALPAVPDPERPYHHPGFRDAAFDRYWRLEPGLLEECYWAGPLSGLESVFSYTSERSLAALVLEPSTWGLWTASGTRLYYLDRREPLPQLADTGLTEEPFWGVHLTAEPRRGATRYVRLDPVPYSRSLSAVGYRFVLIDPEGNWHRVTSAGALTPYDSFSGWLDGEPKGVVLPLVEPGSYRVRLETRDGAGNQTVDLMPWINAEITPLQEFDLAHLVPEIQGLAYDALSRLWAWTGSHLLPLKVHYHGYILDRERNLVYVTEPYTSVRFE